MPRRWNARASCSASPCPDSSGGATLGATEAAEAGLVLDVAAATATRYAALDPGLVADVKRTVAMAAGGAFDAVLDFEAWAPGVVRDETGRRRRDRGCAKSFLTISDVIFGICFRRQIR